MIAGLHVSTDTLITIVLVLVIICVLFWFFGHWRNRG